MSRAALLLRIATVSVLATSTLGAVSAAPANAAVPTCDGLAATIVGTAARDKLTGTDGDDVIVGLAGNDVIEGGAGNDVICGNRGKDGLNGDDGDDRVYGQRGQDFIMGADGDDTLSGGFGRRTSFAAGPGTDHYQVDSERVTLDYSSAPGPVSVDLGAGTASGWGSDTFDFGPAFMLLYGSTYADDLVGSERSEVINGSTVYGSDSPDDVDTIHGLGGVDYLHAVHGTLYGGDGDDFLGFSGSVGSESSQYGGRGDDNLNANDLSDGFHFEGGPGLDQFGVFLDSEVVTPFTFDMVTGTLDDGTGRGVATGIESFAAEGAANANATSFDISGTEGPNRFTIETSAPVTVHALGGDDVIHSGTGDDTLLGGAGDDTAHAGDGRDTCTSIEHASDC